MREASVRENEAIERRCAALESKPPLDHQAVDRAIGRLRDPDLVRERLGAPLIYAQRVEAEVAQLPIDVALPHAKDDHMGRFLAVWTPDEVGHGEAQARLMQAVGLRAAEAKTDDWLASHVAGLASRGSRHLHEIVLMLYHTVGAMNEKLAMSAYQQMARIAEHIGEPELAEALFGPMRRDESLHLGYYRTYARELGRQLQPWQRSFVRWLVVKTYAPVGARRPQHKATLGRTIAALGEKPDDPEIAALIQAIAQEVLQKDGPELPPFTRTAFARCADAARAEDPSFAVARTPVRGGSAHDVGGPSEPGVARERE
jgi:hypothetical protein